MTNHHARNYTQCPRCGRYFRGIHTGCDIAARIHWAHIVKDWSVLAPSSLTKDEIQAMK